MRSKTLVAINRAELDRRLVASGLSAADVARRVGMSPQNLSLMLVGRVRRTHQHRVAGLAAVLGVDPSLLTAAPIIDADADANAFTSEEIDYLVALLRKRWRSAYAGRILRKLSTTPPARPA